VGGKMEKGSKTMQREELTEKEEIVSRWGK